MEAGQFFALYAMFALGLVGFLVVLDWDTHPRWLRVLGIVWAVAWMGPPLALVWIRGVFG